MKVELSKKELFVVQDALAWMMESKQKLPYGRKKEYRQVFDKLEKVKA